MVSSAPRHRHAVGLIVTLAAAATVLAALLFPPVDLAISGTDAANYRHAAAQYAHGHDSGREFLPPELSEADSVSMRAALLRPRDSEALAGLLTPFVFVDLDDKIVYPHQHLQPRVAAVVERAVGDPSRPYLDFALFGVAAALIGCIVWRLGKNLTAALVTTLAYATLPSHVELARYPMSEPLTTVLVLVLVLLATRDTPARDALCAIPLLALPHVREEFFVPVLVVVAYLTVVRPRFWAQAVVALIVSSWVGLLTASDAVTRVLVSMSFEPSVIWPTPGAFADAVSDPLVARGLLVPVATLGTALGFAAPVVGPARVAASRVIGAVRHRPWLPIVALAVLTVAGDVYKAGLAPGTLQLGVIRPARFATGWLLWESSGLILVVGLVGLVWWLPLLTRRIGPIAWLVVLPLVLGLAIDMQATPPNELWWTRRFHPLIYPLLVIGVGAAVHRAMSAPRRRGWAAGVTVGLVVTMAAQFALVGDRYPEVRDGFFDAEHVAAIDERLDAVQPGAVVLFADDAAGQKLPVHARTSHAAYGFVMWGEASLPEVVLVLERSGRPVYVDSLLLERVPLPGDWVVVTSVPTEGGLRSVPLSSRSSAGSEPAD